MKISLALQNRPYSRLIVIVLFSLAGSWAADPVTAAVYECKGDNGSKVLTDRPKGLRGCVLIETLAPFPSGNGAPSSDSRMPSQAQDDQALSGSPLPQTPQLPPRPASLEPTQSGGQADQPAASPGRESRPCPPGINPLNPLTRGHCAPDAPHSPGATQEP